MLAELCIPLTLKCMGFGRPLDEAERIAAIMIVRVVLLCALMGCTICLPGKPDRQSSSYGIPLHGTGPVIGCGIFPGTAGTAPGHTRSPPDTQ